MAESLIGPHTQELIEQHPELKEKVDALVSRASVKTFFAADDPNSGMSRIEALLVAKYEYMLQHPESMTPEFLKLLIEKDKAAGDADAVLHLFVDLNRIPEETKEALAGK